MLRMGKYSAHQLKYMAWGLSRRRNVASDDKFTGVLSEAKVDLNPHLVEAAQMGTYSLTKENVYGQNYRISHPLAKYVIAEAKSIPTSNATVTFDYSGSNRKIALLKNFVGQSGLLKVRIVRYNSLREYEEQIVMVATDANGSLMEDEFITRLMTLQSTATYNDDKFSTMEIEELLEKQQAIMTADLEAHNSDLISEEIVKIENWAEDNRKALQQKLNELDKAIEEKSNEFVKERNLRKKLTIQKEKDQLNEKRDVAWREFDEKRITLKKEKICLIQKLYDIAETKVETVDEFTIKWEIV